MECRHLDGDPGNNWWWNLQWGTRQENSDDKFDHGTVLQCEDHPKVVITAVMVAEARRAYAGGENLYSIARRLGAKPNTKAKTIDVKLPITKNGIGFDGPELDDDDKADLDRQLKK